MPRKIEGLPADIEVEIDEDLIAQFEAIPPVKKKADRSEKNKILLLKYWPEKRHEDVARLLGMSVKTAEAWYRELTEVKEI